MLSFIYLQILPFCVIHVNNHSWRPSRLASWSGLSPQLPINYTPSPYQTFGSSFPPRLYTARWKEAEAKLFNDQTEYLSAHGRIVQFGNIPFRKSECRICHIDLGISFNQKALGSEQVVELRGCRHKCHLACTKGDHAVNQSKPGTNYTKHFIATDSI